MKTGWQRFSTSRMPFLLTITNHGYSKLRNAPTRQETTTTNMEQSRTNLVGLPYISGLSERLTRVFQSRGVNIYHKPVNTLRSLLVHPKDKTPRRREVVQCTTSNATAVVITTLERPAEHWGREWWNTRNKKNSAVWEHESETGHKMDWKADV